MRDSAYRSPVPSPWMRISLWRASEDWLGPDGVLTVLVNGWCAHEGYMSRGFDVRFPVTAGTYAIAANLRHGDATDARDYLVEVPVGFDGEASSVAQRLACCACLSHAPLSSTPTHPAASKRIFEASCPACLQR